jgi:hypothetical protein
MVKKTNKLNEKIIFIVTLKNTFTFEAIVLDNNIK